MATTEATQAPKPRTKKEIDDALAMPPPPNPIKDIILEPELSALSDSLKNAVAQTGLVYKFYAETSKLKGARNIPPPQSLTAALGREIEKYDQICDAMEAHLLRAIAVLQRDLAKEEKRIADEQAALKAQREQLVATPEPMLEDDASTGQALKGEGTLPSTQNNSPLSSHPGRRPSAISISSLHRPSFPHKLDLSSVSFRMPEENPLFQSGLGSPVTLAPRSARPLGANELPPDFMSAFGGSSSDSGRQADIDLTLPDVIQGASVDLTAGDSSDKPIELDLDVDLDLFGDESGNAGPSQDSMETSGGLFSPGLGAGSTNNGPGKDDFFNHLEGDHGEIFSALASSTQGGAETPKVNHSQPDNLSMPSPGTFLNNFSSTNPDNGNTNEQFDFNGIDLTNIDPGFFSAEQTGDLTFPVDYTMGDPKEPGGSSS
ncbi:hypothetical protein EST38_g7412 [Candolleomyces aberdarensis]|uniref:Uncharacterized protein n=1 Tax=Candolleomyces aberdarensis TaxID=2316362 RepID=A0A4Q2DHE2_9AGAR|nr:hypothetical protein EST38_g7412 [Candolleomyces aberdarensis]